LYIAKSGPKKLGGFYCKDFLASAFSRLIEFVAPEPVITSLPCTAATVSLLLARLNIDRKFFGRPKILINLLALCTLPLFEMRWM
jgi:hypothetical protein